jgi:hypothetical protein
VSTLRDMNVGAAKETSHADVLCGAMVDEMRGRGDIRTDEVAAAFRTVPRHLFAPGEPLEKAYAASSSVVTKRDEHGIAISSVSSTLAGAPATSSVVMGRSRAAWCATV